MSYPILYRADETDFFHLGLGPLTNTLQARVTEERNGCFILEAVVFIDETIFPMIKENQLIKADAGHRLKEQRFRIKRIVPKHSGKAEIYAEHVSYLTSELPLKPEMALHTLTGQQAIETWKNGIIENNPFEVFSDIETQHSTNWRVDKVQHARQALGGVEGSLLDVWGGEYLFDNYHLSLLKKRGKTANTMLAYGRNVTDFEQEKNITNTYTSIYPFAVVHEENQNDRIITIPSYIVDAENWNSFPNRKVLPVDFSSKFEQEEVPTSEKLEKFAKEYIKNNEIGKPKTAIRVSFLDLSKTADYQDVAPLEEVSLCDDVTIIYPKLGVNVVAKVVRTVWNVLSDCYDEIEIGEKRSDLGTILKQQETTLKEVVTQVGTMLTSADNKHFIFHGLFGTDGLGQPQASKKGDIWFKPNGTDLEMYVWNGTVWEDALSDAKLEELRRAFEKQKTELETSKRAIAEMNTKVEQAVEEAGFAKDGLTVVEEKATDALSQAQAANKKGQSILQDVDALRKQVVDAEGNIMDLGAQYSYLSEGIDTVVARADQLTEQVSEAKQTADRFQQLLTEKTASLTTRLTNSEQRLDGFKTEVLEQIQGVTTRLSVSEQTVTRFQNSLSEQVNGLVTRLTESEQNIQGFQQRVTDQLKGITSTQTQLSDQYTRVIETIGGVSSGPFDLNSGWEAGSINTSGEPFDFPTTVRTKTYIPITSGSPFYVVDASGEAQKATAIFYDSEKHDIKRVTDGVYFAPPDGVKYVKFVLGRKNRPIEAIEESIIQSTKAQVAMKPLRTQLIQTADRFNLTVQKGDLIAQLNLEAGKTLIQNKQLVLDAETTILTGQAFIPMAMIKDLRVDAATIYGTLDASKVRTINLDAANLTSGYINNARLRSRSITADKLATDAIQVGFNNYSQNLKIDPYSLNFYNGTQLAGKLTSEGMEFWYGTRKIGQMGENGKKGNENVRGVSMNLEYEGDYISWSYRKTRNDDAYTTMLMLDPKGKFTGKSGIHLDADVYLSRVKPDASDAREFLTFATVKYNSYSYSGLLNQSRKTGMFMGGNWLYFLHNNQVIPVEEIKKVVYALKGLGKVSIPTNIASDGTVTRWTNITL